MEQISLLLYDELKRGDEKNLNDIGLIMESMS